MIAWAPAVNQVYKYLTTTSSKATNKIDLPSVEIHNVETAPEKRPRTLKHLLKANHINHAVFYNSLRYHNHMPHILGSAYLLGAEADHLNHIYDELSKELIPWVDSPGEVTDTDWRDFLGDRRYQRAYVDFFEDELVLKYNYNWKRVAEEYLFSGRNPLINCVITGRKSCLGCSSDQLCLCLSVGHPLIHLGYAYELSSREVGMEALSLIASSYNYLHKYLDDESYTIPSPNPSTSPLELLRRLANDDRFEGLLTEQACDCDTLYEKVKFEPLIIEYWNAWRIENPKKEFEESQKAAVMLLVATVNEDKKEKYDFFLLHLLTTSHAVRILLPLIPGQFHINLVRQWWLLTLTTYVGQLRPKFDEKLIEEMELEDIKWNYVTDKATNGPWAMDEHFVKGKSIL
jgi:hypothetical protein